MTSSHHLAGKNLLVSGFALVVVAGLALGSCGGAQKSAGNEPAQVLPPLKVDPFAGLDPLGKDDEQAFTFRTGPKPPPSVTKKVSLKFPVAQRAKIAARAASRKVASGPLKVLRLQPHGKVKTVGAVTVSFNQAMVPVASLAKLKTLDVPVILSPRPKGRWRWLGTRTVAFEPAEGRLPYATDYRVSIPAGTQSAIGGRLERKTSVTFSTPTPKILRGLPSRWSNQARPDTAIALLFNQKVDRRRVVALLTMNPGKLHADDVDLLPPESWAKLPDIGHVVATWDPDRVVVLRPKRPLSKATSYRVMIRPGLRGEGPKPSPGALVHSFRTYSPLKVDFLRCADRRRCAPRSGFYARFNNPLVTQDLRPYIRFSPPVSDLQAKVRGRYVSFRGDFKAQTTYRVRISQDKAETGPKDSHDQQLLSPYQVAVKTGDLRPELSFPVRGLATLERSGRRLVPLSVTNVRTSRLRMVRVAPEQILKLIAKARYSWDDKGRRDPLKGIKGIRVKRTLRTRIPRNGRGKIGIATDEALGPRGSGPVYIELRSSELKRYDRWSNPYRGIVVQVTDLALMARYGNDKIVALVTQMQTGKALAKVPALLRDRDGKVIWRGASDAQGMIRAPGRRALAALHPAPFVLWVKRGSDKAFLVLDQRGDDGGYLYSYYSSNRVPPKKTLRMHLFTDRSPYRPKETVHLKGVLRVLDMRPQGGVEAIPKELKKVKFEVKTSRGHKIQEGELALSASGAFAVDVAIPPQADLGTYHFRVKPLTGPYPHWIAGTFRVEEYRPPEFKVKVETSPGPHFIGTILTGKLGADYLFGAPMARAKVSWTLSRKQGSYTPPGNPGFSFAEPIPWNWRWRLHRARRRYRRGRRMGYVWRSRGSHGEIVASGDALLGPDGRLGVEAPLKKDEEDQRIGPLSFTLEAQVVDKNRQAIANRKTVVVHPASVYVGLRAKKAVIKAGESLDVSAVLVDLGGKRQVGEQLEIEALRVETKVSTVFKDGRWTYHYESVDKRIGSCQVTSADVPKSCALTLPKSGAYKLQSATQDAKGRKTRTTIRVYAYGPGYVPWNLKNQGKIELIADKKHYEVGDVAKILVKSPLRGALGLMSVQRGGIDTIRRLEMKGNAQVIELRIAKHHLPGVHVAVALGRGRLTEKSLGKAAKDLGRPTFAHGTIYLPVSMAEKTVSVAVKPARKVIGPSQKLKISIKTKDYRGRPVPAEVALMVVDEGVLSLLGFKTPDPSAVFWARRGPGAVLADSRNALLGRKKALRVENRTRHRGVRNGHGRRARRAPQGSASVLTGALAAGGYGRGGGGGLGRGGLDKFKKKSGSVPDSLLAQDGDDRGGAKAEARSRAGRPIRSRSTFATTAFYTPSLMTSAKGTASVTVQMPDNLTTFRIMAVALDRFAADRFGKGEAQVKVRKALLLRPSLPRFLSVGDRFEASVMVHNETDRAGKVDVLVRGRNAKAVGTRRRRVAVAAHGSKELRFPMKVAHAGPARIQFAAVLGKDVDAVEKQVPVLLPVTTEAFATYGMTEKSVAQPIVPPGEAIAGYGGLDVSLSSTALNGLEDSVRYLVSYPWECTEQTASRVIPIFALKEILSDFNIATLKDQKHRRLLARAGIRKLESYQRWDGGWGYWQGSRESWLYVSTYVTMALLEGKAHGEAVSTQKLMRARRFLKRRLDHPHYGERRDWVSQTAAAWILSRLKQYERAHLTRLYGLRKELPIFARAWLMSALYRSEGKSGRVRELLREIDNAAVQTASAAHFAEGMTESLRLLMHSNDRTDAIVLSALLEVAPEHALMPKLARGLLQARVRGRWSTTQANAYALMALSRYYKQVEKVIPEHTDQLWYGDRFMGQGTFKGREMKVVQQHIPLATLRKLGEKQLVLAKKGRGKLYYRIGLRYAPTDLVLEPEEQGFSISRVYESIRDPKGKKQKGTVKRRKDGSWEIAAGATVRVRLVLVVPDRRYFVAVMDPLPAGLEAVNLGFKTAARARLARQLDHRVYDSWSFYSFFAFDHKAMRDDRVVLFADRLPAGVYEYTYLARATSYGDFVVAPAKAEEMYHPETFGRSATTWVHVK